MRQNQTISDRLAGALYLCKIHLPGWITRQFFLKYILRFHIIIRPWALIKLFYANMKATQLIKK